jgi:hypothetical protein
VALKSDAGAEKPKISFAKISGLFDFRRLQHYPPTADIGTPTSARLAAELFALGHANSNGIAFSKSSIRSMLEGWPAGDFAALEA